MIPAMLEAARAEATLGEICNALRAEWGEHTEPASSDRPTGPRRPRTMSAMAEQEPGAEAGPRQHVVVVGADTTCVRLVEELVRAGEQLVVIAPGERGRDNIDDLRELGATVIAAQNVRQSELRRAGVAQAKAAVILGDDDVLAVRVALAIEELAPGLRFVIEMSNPNIGGKLTELLGDCTLPRPPTLAAPAFVARAMETADTQTFEIGGRMVAAGPGPGRWPAARRDRRLEAGGMDAVLPKSGDIVLGTELPQRSEIGSPEWVRSVPLTRLFDRAALVVIGCWSSSGSATSTSILAAATGWPRSTWL
jgi:hypothetical protein